MSDAPGSILFTAFEPSGDDHAAAVIAELKRRRPDRPIHAWGGPNMADAGAEVVEQTGQDAVMGVPGLGKILEHRRINKRVAAWMDEHRPAVHVPVDSPAANFPVCALAKARSARVVHLVAPQVWAWGSWRVRKLRRLTDHVCCVLPFEEGWFATRGVPASFVGHPLFDEPIDTDALDTTIAGWGADGSPRIAIMPGSRPSEMLKNFPLLVDAFRTMAREHPGLSGMVAATRAELEPALRRLAMGGGRAWPESLRIESGRTDEVTRWCDMALVVSGTVTLQIARQHKPMVIVYKSGRLYYNLLARWLVRTPHFSLPNLIAGERIVPELIPHFGGPGPIAQHAIDLLESHELADEQRKRLGGIAQKFDAKHAARGAADIIERIADGLSR